MIQFPCKCSYAFELPQDQAGGLVQCPACHLLVDVPTLSELTTLNPDGTYAFGDDGPLLDATTAADLHRAFTPRTTDEHGRQKDLRPTEASLRGLGAAPDQPARVVPRYDPTTGELIRPLALRDEAPRPVVAIAVPISDTAEFDPDVEILEAIPLDAPPLAAVPISSVPVAAVPVLAVPVLSVSHPATPVPKARRGRSLGYASGDARHAVTLGSVALDLLMPANAVVLFFLFLVYVAGFYLKVRLSAFATNFGLSGAAVALLNVPLWMALAHFGCVVEDTGPDAMDELPRPWRDFRVGDDLLVPTLRVALAMVLCFGPAMAVAERLDAARPGVTPLVLLLWFCGAFAFPAVALTTLTGSTLLNLTPGRVAGVIRACGEAYLLAVVTLIATIALTAGFVLGPAVFPALAGVRVLAIGDRFIVAMPVLAITVYLTHLFAWQLGLMYRAGHDRFPWVAQRHIPRPRAELRRTNFD